MVGDIKRTSILFRAFLLGTTAIVLVGGNDASARVGVTSATDGDPLGKPPQQNERVLRIGIDVQANEVITTEANDRAHLVFLDGTSLTVGPNARLTIDRFVFDPASKTGDLAISASKGVFRLVGGKISKTKPITITTPSTTIGIRGGITLVDVATNQTTSTFIFGNDMTVTGQGQTQTVTRPGSQVVTNTGSAPGQPTLVGQGALSGQMAQLEGRSGGQGNSQGGTGQGPGGNADVGAQNFGQQNSAQGPQGTAPKGPGQNSQPNVLNNDNPLTNANQQQQTQNAAPPAEPKTTTTKVVVTRGTAGRLIGHPTYSNFNNTDLSVTPDPNHNKALASTGPQTTTTTTTTANGTTTTSVDRTITITVPGSGNITLPWQQDTLANGFDVGTLQVLGNTLTKGKGYVSADGTFFAYVFDFGSEQVGLFGGTPTSVASFPTTGIGAYDLKDLGNPAAIPFARETVGAVAALQNAKSQSKLYTAFSNGISATIGQPVGDARSTAMQATISISGQGSAQKSYMGVFTGLFFRDVTNNGGPVVDKGIALSGAYNGSYRLDSSSQIGRQTSAISTADTGNGNAIYGEGGGAFALTPDRMQTTFTLDTSNNVTSVTTTRTPQASFDQPYNNLNGQDYYSVTAATKSSPGTVGQTRTTQSLNGFAGSLIEQRSSGGAFSTRAVTTDAPTDFNLSTDSSTNRAAVTFTAQNWDAGTSATFKLGGLTGSSSGTSSFIDDNTYAVRDRPTDISDTTTVGGSATGVTSRTAMVSYNAAPVDSFFLQQGVTPCTCEFLTWGWWGGDIRYDTGAAYNVGGRDRVHLGTYVAGTLSTFANLPNTGTATFSGHAIGNVQNAGAAYVAAGTFGMNWNWGSQTGTVNINNFDNASYSGNAALVGSTVQFTGNISGAGRTGSVNGAFFSSSMQPVAGVGGNFSIGGPNYNAAGTFMGKKQ